jgi:hypothetical protein
MKGKRWGTQEKPEKGGMGRPQRVRVSGAGRPAVIRKSAG